MFFFNRAKAKPLYPDVDTTKLKEFQQFASKSPDVGRVKGGYIPEVRLIKKGKLS